MSRGTPGAPWCTPVEVSPPPWTWAPGQGFFFLGSCFAQSMREAMASRGLPAFEGPFGQLYNPLSLAQGLDLLLGEAPWDRDRLFEFQGRWRHPLFHTLKSHPDRQVLEESLEEAINRGRQDLAGSEFLVLTLGTSWLWRHRGDGQVWANCHGLPAGEFISESGDLETLEGALGGALDLLNQRLPHIKVILTLSPVRHLAQGLPANGLSKALLRVLISRLEGRDRWYFPAYEIFMDELRDYRWTQEDLVHPSAAAQGVILERFVEALAQKAMADLWHRAGKAWALQSHRPRFPELEETQAQRVAQAWEALRITYPFLKPPEHRG